MRTRLNASPYHFDETRISRKILENSLLTEPLASSVAMPFFN